MRGKVARDLRKAAQMNSVGEPKEKTRQLYKRLKTFHKSLNK